MNELQVYNTLSNRKETFSPVQPGRILMYVCGITAYDFCHIGHARSVVVFDVIFRYLRYLGFDVVYVRNFTDVDDKIIKRAQEEGSDPQAVAERYIKAFHEDMDRLAVARPTYEPRATEFIPEMVGLIQRLLEKGHAYTVGGEVYFAVESFPDYGKLSRRSLDEMLAGARVEVDPNKQNPMDFVLWKASKPGEPSWPSPWGPGRPGWHIECSAMSASLLGSTFDIHGGGKDLIFPHHENEIAQSEAAHGAAFARYWIHHGFVNVNQEKMSKSLGNFFTLRRVLERYHPEVLRMFLVSSHYRSPVDFSPESMEEAERGLERLYQTLAQIEDSAAGVNTNASAPADSQQQPADLQEKIEELPRRFRQEMNNDFNTAAALGHLFEVGRRLNRFLDSCSRGPTAAGAALLRRGAGRLQECGGILGLLQESPAEFLRKQRRLHLTSLGIDEEEVERLIAERARARREKNWARADEIRAWLAEKSILLEDRPDRTHWRVKQQAAETEGG